jgi:hypothetical protein
VSALDKIDEVACPRCSAYARGQARFPKRGNVHVMAVDEIHDERVVITAECECGVDLLVTIETLEGDLYVRTEVSRERER